MMKKNEATLKGCPYDDLTEFLCLDVKLSDGEKKKAQIHLQQCSTCRKKFEELEGIYTQLNEEVQKPVANKTLDLAKQIRAKDTKYGLVVCEPIKVKKKDKSLSYKTKVLFTANGAGSTKDKKLTDFDLQSLPEDNIAIRAMTDTACNKLLLYLWHSSSDNFEGWELKMPNQSQRATFNHAGVSQIPFMEIEDLGDKVIYFEEKHNTSIASENRFMSIVKAISPK